MFTAVQITSLLSVIIITGFVIYVYLEIKSMKKDKTIKTQNKVNYADCPDFFETVEKDGKKYCKNTYKLGSCNNKQENDTISFEDEDLFTDNQKGNLMKCKWSKQCDIPWNSIDRLC
jgi:hypothetical protein